MKSPEHARVTGQGAVLALTSPNQALHLTANSVRSVRRVSGMEACGNTLGVQAPNEPLELSIIDHSMR